VETGRGDPLLPNTLTITTLYALMYRTLFNLLFGFQISERFPSGERLRRSDTVALG
jgi:hypothetical protein